VSEACKHYKAIFAIGEGIELLKAAHLPELVPGLQLAASQGGMTPVDSLGIVTVASWDNRTSSERKTGEKEVSAAAAAVHAVGAAVSTVSGAISGAIGKMAGTGAALKVSDIVGNKALTLFVNHVANNRFWTRDTTRVPN